MSILVLKLGFVQIKKLLSSDVDSDFLFDQSENLFRDESLIYVLPNVYLMHM
jgi:hypothetical protein